MKQLEVEHDNLRAALAWSQSVQDGAEVGLRLVGALRDFWYVQGYLSEGRQWLVAALRREHGASATARAKALSEAGWLMGLQGDYERATAYFEESLALFRDLGDNQSYANTLEGLGWSVLQGDQSDIERAVELFKESLVVHRERGDKQGCADSLNALGWTVGQAGELIQAASLLEEALDLRRQLGDWRGAAVSLHNLGWVAHRRNEDVQAYERFVESISLHRELGFKQGIADCLVALAVVAGTMDQPKRAVQLLGAAEAIYESIGSKDRGSYADDYRRTIATVGAQLGEVTFASIWVAGRTMTLEQAISEAFEVAGDTLRDG